MASTNTSSGTVRQLKNGTWLLRISAGHDPLTGKRLQPSRVVRGTFQKAKQELIDFQHEVLHSQATHDKMTLDELFNLWISAPTKSGRVRATNTRYHDEGRYRRYVQPALGKRQVNNLKPKDFSFLYDALLTRPVSKKSSTLSPRTVHHVHSLLRAMYSWAWRRELVPENPVLRADSPSVPLSPPLAPHRHVVNEHLEILRKTNNDLAVAVWMAATLGLRRSEIAALKFSHFDFKDNQINIVSGVTKTPGSDFKINNTKTGLHGCAVFPLHPYTRQLIEHRLGKFRNQIQTLGNVSDSDGFVFSSDPEQALPLHPDALSKALLRHCKAHPECEAITLLSMRKYAVSDLAGTGADRSTASAILRNRPETTDRHYSAANSREVREHTLGLANRLLALAM